MVMKLENIKNILILGSGTLGLRVGLASAISGYKVKIFDIDECSFKEAERIQDSLLDQLIKDGRLEKSKVYFTKSMVNFTSDAVYAASNADLVSESVTEDREIKTKVWRQFGALCPEHTIFTTNTSYLLPSMFAEASGRPERFCALHFHDVFYANVVDVMPHPGTAPWMIPLLADFGRSIDQTPVVMEKESYGYIFNSMLMAMIGAAGALVTNSITDIENVDRSWMGNFKMPMGPFGILDEIGLETAWHVTRNNQDKKSIRFAKLLESYVQQGKLGKKTGQGFYTYPNPAYQREGFLAGN
jgi:3-hydroxybutyryl-CoA dehydrogenase